MRIKQVCWIEDRRAILALITASMLVATARARASNIAVRQEAFVVYGIYLSDLALDDEPIFIQLLVDVLS